ncbi:hypothetical protein TA3x_001372 [Tundrisphaera sp. TA3]|uniref:hypothetical protein n=1 Tax=Tundrisphaera sp. TA3 TaxID=3435775 RepID=UPI003EC12230
MSSGNKKGESHQNPGQNGGAASGAREKVQQVGQQVQQGLEQASGRLREGYDSARENALHGYRRAEGSVARNPTSSVLIGFGIGFGLGLVLTSMFSRREETWAEKYLPESLQDVPDRYKSLVASLRGVPDSVKNNLPYSISKHLG